MIEITELLNQYQQKEVDLYIADKFIVPHEWILTDYLQPPDNHHVLMYNPCDCYLLIEPRYVDYEEEHKERFVDDLGIYLEKKRNNHEFHGMFIGNYSERRLPQFHGVHVAVSVKDTELKNHDTELKNHDEAGEYYMHNNFCKNWNPARPKYWIPMPRLPFDCRLKDAKLYNKNASNFPFE